MIKIFASKDPDGPSEPHVFMFTSPNAARAEADTMKEALTTVISALKAGSGAATPAAGTPGASSAAMAITSAGSAKQYDIWTRNLENDLELQKSLLASNPDLQQTFKETVMTKILTVPQFWSTRVHLLRQYALEKAQARGPYNVFASIKPTVVDNVSRMSLSREQIHDIFTQHPLVKTVYDENVPKLPEGLFWERFFQSRLFKKLKGEKILPTDRTDTIFDRYLHRGNEDLDPKRRRVEHVPLTIDLEGNEQNITIPRGNQPDRTMRPQRAEDVPIIRTLNSLSMKLLDLVTEVDGDRELVNQDELYMKEQRLADLQGSDEEERIILHIQDQRKFFSGTEPSGKSEFAGMDPKTVIEDLRQNLGTEPIDLANVMPSCDSDDSDDSGDENPSPSVELSAAARQVTAAVHDRRSQLLISSSNYAVDTGGLPPKTFASVSLVHATTNEFLHHFWLAFLSGDEKRAGDIAKLVTSLQNSKERIETIAAGADEERNVELQRRKKELQDEYRRTGIKPKKRAGIMNVGGGRQVVEEVLSPTVIAVDKALTIYQSALAEVEKATSTSASAAPASSA